MANLVCNSIAICLFNVFFLGLSWLLQTMNEDFPSLQERVLKDIEVQVNK